MKETGKSGNKRHIAFITAASLILTLVFSFPIFAEGVNSLPPDSAITGEYVPGDVILCIRPGEADEKKIASSSAGIFNSAPEIDSGFLMDVSEAAEAFKEEGITEEAGGQGKTGLSSLFSSAIAGMFPSIKKDSGKTVLKLIHSDTMSTEELIKLYSGKPGVLFAEPNYISRIEGAATESGIFQGGMPDEEPGEMPVLLSSPSNAETPDMTGLQYAFGNGPGGIDVPDWNKPEKHNSDGVVVAVVDSGVDYNHEDLAPVMWDEGLKYDALKKLGGGKYGINTGHDYYKGAYPKDKDDPKDTLNHGTHVAGIIAASWNGKGVSGAANGVRIMAVNIMIDDIGNTPNSSALKGFNYVLTAKKAGVNVRAVNCSFGGPDNSYALSFCHRELGENDIVTCYASANNSVNNDTGTVCSSVVTLDNPSVITVNSCDREGRMSGFTDYGLRTTHIYAPGSEIMSTMIDRDSEVISDKTVSEPVNDTAGNELYDDFSTGETRFIYTPNTENGTDIEIREGELIVKDTKISVIDDKITEDTIGGKSKVKVAFSVSLNGPLEKDPEKRGYSLIYKRRIADPGKWYEFVFVKTTDGKWDYLSPAYGVTNTPYYQVYSLDKTNNGSSVDLENPEFRFLLLYYEDGETVIKEYAIDELWITDAPVRKYKYLQGTSMAAPAVTGEVAILAAGFPSDSAGKLAARVLAGARKTETFRDSCITGGMANVRNSLDESTYTPVISTLRAENNSLIIKGYFFGSKNDAEVSISQEGRKWSTSAGTLEIKDVVPDEKGDGDMIILKIPEGLKNRVEAEVKVRDRGRKNPDRQEYTRRLIPEDPESCLEESGLYPRLPISEQDMKFLSNLFVKNALSLNGSLYFFYKDAEECDVTVSYKDGEWIKRTEAVSSDSGPAVIDGMIVYGDGNDLVFYDGEKKVKRIPFIPEKGDNEIPESDKWVLDIKDDNDRPFDLYYDGKDLLLFRSRYAVSDPGENEFREVLTKATAVYLLDPATGRGKYLGLLNNYYPGKVVTAHEEREGSSNRIYIIGRGEDDSVFRAERFTVSPFKTEDISRYAPEGAGFDHELVEYAFWSGCGTKEGIYLVGGHTTKKNEGMTEEIASDNYFLSFKDEEEGFKANERLISNTALYTPVAAAGYGKVYFYGFSEEGVILSYTDADTYPHYGDREEEKPEEPGISDPASPLHLTTGEDITELSTKNARYEFILSSNAAVMAGTKADISAAFTSDPAYDNNAKHRYKSTAKAILKVSKKGIITPKKRGEADVECQQKVKGGSWQPLSTKIHLYVQMPEMAKKTDANMGDKGLNAYSFLSKTTYSPTSWKSTNPKVATIDEAGNITVLKPGRTNIIAEYGEGKTGSKKKYRTKLRIR